MSASFHATPQDGTSTPYYGQVHKVPHQDGGWSVSARVSFERPDGDTQTVTVMDDRAYWSVTRGGTDGEAFEVLSAGCVPEQDVPPYNDFEESLEGAVELSADVGLADYSTGSCRSGEGQMYTVAWAGQVYIYCSLGPDAAVHQFVGEGFVADVFDFDMGDSVDDAPEFTVPVMPDGSPVECPVLAALAQASGKSTPAETRRRLAERHEEARSDASQLHKTPWYLRVGDETSRAGRRDAIRRGRELKKSKTCVFVHAWGTSDTGTSDTDTDHWGNVHDYTTCATNVFLKLDTQTTTWDDPSNLAAVCAEITGARRRIFSYGYGALAVTAALETSCSLDDSSRWYVIAPPTAGNAAAGALTDGCSGFIKDLRACTWGGSVKDGAASLLPGYTSALLDWSMLVARMQTDADGIMCGNTPFGVNDASSALMSIFDDTVGSRWRSDVRDGWTELDICKAAASSGASWSTSDASSNFFECSVNAIDLTCSGSNGWTGGDEKRPCNFYQEHGG